MNAVTEVRAPFLSSYRDGNETKHEAADYIGVTYRTFKRYVERRAIPVRKLAGTNALRCYAHELDSWYDGAELEIVCDDRERGLVIIIKTDEGKANGRAG